MESDYTKLCNLKEAYRSRFGIIHVALDAFPVAIQVLMLEMALAGDLDIRARTIDPSHANTSALVAQIKKHTLSN